VVLSGRFEACAMLYRIIAFHIIARITLTFMQTLCADWFIKIVGNHTLLDRQVIAFLESIDAPIDLTDATHMDISIINLSI
jgi:hypothetical protein